MTHLILIPSCIFFFLAGPVSGREILDVTFTTTPAGGKYAPRYVHAVWVERTDKTFVKTLGRWGKKRFHNLATWNAVDGTDADGITGATPRSHGEYHLTWNVRDRQGRRLPHGTYIVWFEGTDHNLKHDKFNRASFTVEHNGKPDQQTHASQGGYENIKLDYRVLPDIRPTVANLSVADLDQSSAVLAGRVVDAGGDDPVVRIHWGDEDGGSNPAAWGHVLELGVKGEETFSAAVKDLTENRTYFFRCWAKNSTGECWASSTETFTPVKQEAQSF